MRLSGLRNQILLSMKKKKNLAEPTLLRHSSSTIKMHLVKFSDNQMHLLPKLTRYSTNYRELTAIKEAIKYFQHFLEGREFFVYTDHKPLIYAFKQKADKISPCQECQLNYISQFTTSIVHIYRMYPTL